MVKFSTQASPSELPTILRQMTTIVDWATWRRRIESLKSELKSNPVWKQFLLERHGLELAFGNVRQHLQMTGRCPWPPRTAEEYRLYSFLAVAVQVHARLNAHGKKKFAGAIRGGLEKEFGLGPIAHEMTMAAHLMSNGFEVEFHDLESDGGFDFLVSRDSIQFEVECKHVSADIGRQIHRRKFYHLGSVLYPLISEAVDQGNDGRLLTVTLPGRLSSNTEQQKAIADCIGAVLSGKVAYVDDSVCAVSVQPFSLQIAPFTGNHGHEREIEEYLKKNFNIESEHVLLNWRPGRAAVFVHFQSQKVDRVLDRFFQRLKADAKKQFSGNLPGFLCVHLADLTQEQLQDLANADQAGTPTGIQRAASILLQIRPQLHSVCFMADGEVRITQERSHDGVKSVSVQEMGPSYVFKNPDHPMGQNPLLDRVFI